MSSKKASPSSLESDSEGGPNTIEFDSFVGARIQHRRRELGLTKKRLGEMIGVSGMQIAYHENGTRRLGAARLYELSKAMTVPVTYFFEGMPGAQQQSPTAAVLQLSEAAHRETLETIFRLGLLAVSTKDKNTHEIIKRMLEDLPKIE